MTVAPPLAPAEGEMMKKKKVKPPAPVPPAEVGTAALAVRYAAARVFGLLPEACIGLQPMWVKEAGTGKLTFSLDKARRTELGKESHDALLDAVQVELDAVLARGATAGLASVARETAAAFFRATGATEDDDEGALTTTTTTTEVATFDGALVGASKGFPLVASLAGAKVSIVGRESSDPKKKKPESMILVAKAKRQLTLKFVVVQGAGGDGALARVAKWDAADFHAATLARLAAAARPLVEAVVAAEVLVSQVSQLWDMPLWDKGSFTDSGTEVVYPKMHVNSCSGVSGTVSASSQEVSQLTEEEYSPEVVAPRPGEMHVDPFTVSGKVDYDKLSRDFGSQLLTPELLARLEKVVKGGQLHRFLRRNIFFSHRDLEKILDCAEKKLGFYLYTGRGPSSAAMHLGHLVPFMMTQWLQEAFEVPLVIQMTDDEKFLWKGNYNDERGFDLDRFYGLTLENAKDIIATGFDRERTLIFSDLDYMGHMYPNVAKIWKSVTYSTARGAFGFTPQSNIGQSAFPAIQAAPSFPSSFKVPFAACADPANLACLIPCAIDQDPYFRVTRDIAHKMVPKTHPLQGKPALLHSKFFPPLQGAEGKMSSSDANSAIFLTDSPEDIERKIKQHAFSGGRDTAREQRDKGADLDVDVSFQWLRFFLDDDDELAKIEREYGSGQGDYWNTNAVKTKLIQVLQDLVASHQRRRETITLEDVHKWMAVRTLKPPPAS